MRSQGLDGAGPGFGEGSLAASASERLWGAGGALGGGFGRQGLGQSGAALSSHPSTVRVDMGAADPRDLQASVRQFRSMVKSAEQVRVRPSVNESGRLAALHAGWLDLCCAILRRVGRLVLSDLGRAVPVLRAVCLCVCFSVQHAQAPRKQRREAVRSCPGGGLPSFLQHAHACLMVSENCTRVAAQVRYYEKLLVQVRPPLRA